MVHALETVHSLLEPAGRLVDLHPADRPPSISVRSGRRTKAAGWVREQGDFVDYQRAEAALAEVVDRCLFTWEAQGEFEYIIAADTVAEMLAHLEMNWKRAILTEDVRQRMDMSMAATSPDKEILISQTIRIGRLRPLTPA
jgi:hypothetical protein